MKEELLSGKESIGVWGLGYVGLTTAVAFAQAGVYAFGYDPDERVVEAVESGKCHIPNLERWMGTTIADVTKTNKLHATSIWPELANSAVHFVAVPTEKDGEPWMEPINDVMAKIASFDNHPLVIIESTLVPGTAKKLRSTKYMLCIAPRRDFFNKPEYNLRNLPRIYSADSSLGRKLATDVLAIVCDTLVPADDITEAELVKSIENSILHVCATYAMQLAHAYPNANIRHALQLASTHWRIPLYYPSMGCGGYCIPTSSRYIIDGARHPGLLTISKEVLHTDDIQPILIAQLMSTCKRVLVMGICYKGDLKVCKGSPAIPIIDHLRMREIDVTVTDPYYTPDELTRLTRAPSWNYVTALSMFDGIVIVADHQRYKNATVLFFRENLRPGMKILDNYGVWEKHRELFKKMGVTYHVIGDVGWTM